MNIEELLIEAKPHLARSVSKNGDFDLAYDYIDQLKDRLTEDQVINLYVFIRDHSDRLEDEWRDEYIEIFEEHENSLPEQQY